MTQIFQVIAPLFLIIFAFALLQRFRNINENWSLVLNEYALKIGLPVLIFSSLAKTNFSLAQESDLIVLNSLFIFVIFLLGFLIGKVFRLSKEMSRSIFLCLVFGNVAYLGIPVLVQLSGESVLPSASLIVAIYLFWIFTIGVSILDFKKKKKDLLMGILKNLVKNPLLLAVILGLISALIGLKIPDVILKSLDMISASVTPTVLIVIGLFIGKSKIGEAKKWIPVFLFSLMTLLLLPAIFYFGVKALGYAPEDFSASIIQAAMPLAITPFALAEKFGLNKDFIAKSIVLSTALSVLSIPFWISIVSQ